MNLELVTLIAELVAALAVVLSLIYLAKQVRQGTKVAKAATRQALASEMQALGSDLVQGDDIAQIFQSHLEGQELKPHEMLRLQARAFRDLRFWDNAYYQHSEGMLTDDEWRGLRENLKAVMRLGAYQEYWKREKTLYSTRFQNLVEDLLNEPLEASKGELIFDSQNKVTGGDSESE